MCSVAPLPGDATRLTQYLGKVIAVATLVSYVEDETVDADLGKYTKAPNQRRWYFGPFGYVLQKVVALKTPVSCRGMQGFWPLPVDVERQVVEQLGEREA